MTFAESRAALAFVDLSFLTIIIAATAYTTVSNAVNS
jgi:hypothetical protein